MQKHQLKKDEDNDIKMDNKKWNGFSVKGKGGENEQTGGSKVINQDRAEEAISRILKTNRIVLQSEAHKF